MNFKITGLELENHSLQVPEGLSELLAANEIGEKEKLPLMVIKEK